jgi:GH18 family chitinase
MDISKSQSLFMSRQASANSKAFGGIVDSNWRAEFVRSSVKMVLDLGLDGIDIDYEWLVLVCGSHAFDFVLREID